MLNLALAAALLSAPAAQAAAPQQPAQLGASNYQVDEPLARPADAQLIWSDEFDGSTLDKSKWQYDTALNKGGWANHELQYYAVDRPENLRVADGHLSITARRDQPSPKPADFGGQRFTSARIFTKGRASWTYGFYEIRARIPCERGSWPAIWMLPDVGRWPSGGEIDVMEHVGWDPRVIHGTLHTELFTHSKGTQRGAQVTVPTACTEFHRYQLDWQPDAITVGVDDRAYMKIRNDQPGGRGAWPFDRPFHMILNVAVGGDWGGAKGVDQGSLPWTMEVDYVRVWQAPNEAER